jgi:hypothetical protein
MSKFNNIEEVLKDERLTHFLDKRISHISFKRSHIPEGTRLKRSPVDFLEERGWFNSKDLISLYIGIVGKKTNLPSAVREFITEIVRQSIIETINEIQ